MSPQKIIAIVVLLVVQAAFFIALALSPSLQEVVLGGDDGASEWNVSGERLNEIIDTVRESQRLQWHRQHVDVASMYDEVAKLHSEYHQRLIATCGEQYTEQLMELATSKRASGQATVIDREGSLIDIYDGTRNLEVRIVELVREMRAMATAVRENPPPAPRLAVAQAQDVPPQRPAIDGEKLEARIVNRKGQAMIDFKEHMLSAAAALKAMKIASERIVEQARHIDDQDLEDGDVSFAEEALTQNLANLGERLELWDMRDSTYNEGGFQPTAGRVVGKNGVNQDWMYVDRWYVIGPWDNPRRSKSGASFLPETLVDLDSVAVGKDDVELKWEYITFNSHKLDPPRSQGYAIWYYYTEMWFDEGGTYYASIGADDYGKLWINGDFVFETSQQISAFNAEEAAQPLEFKQGLNKILFRLENAGGTASFGFVLNCYRVD